jgi:galactose mutarotase-like enzyme
VIVLRSDRLLARLDPRHGAEVLDLVDLDTGRQLLGRPPFGSDLPLAGDLDEDTWTARYRGGWQIVAPNAGNPCDVDGVRHGFHGRASNDPWSVEDVRDGEARLGWAGHGLALTRTYALDDDALVVRTAARATGEEAAFVALEHVAMGLELLDPGVAIDLPDGEAYELDEAAGPPQPPADAGRYPFVRLLDGSLERADRWELAEPRTRLFVVANVPEGRAVVRNPSREQGLELLWDAEALPHIWVWHDVRTAGGIWRGRNEVLTVEPASVPHSLGLDAAIRHGQARILEPGGEADWWIAARPFSG